MKPGINGVAFVTGAGSGIGQACTLELVRGGATGILITDLNEKGLEQTVRMSRAINENLPILAEVADITLDGTATRLVSKTAEKFGRLDYALNVAGVVGKQGPIDQIAPAEYDFVTSVNARAVWLCERAEIAQMLKQDRGQTHDGRTGDRGAIVNIASICGLVGFPYSTPYTMTKHAVLGLTKSDSTTFAAQGIRINSVCPGIIDTPLINAETRQFSESYAEKFTAMKRLGTAQEIADMAIFLCSSRATYITGAAMVVDGGHTAQ
ncbi:hypothetical protein RBB50_004984 [Rhinocladiella similis]